jgi:hypothetical protein
MPGVREQIRNSDFLIADITQLDPAQHVNPNVMYELGFAMALNKRVLVFRRNAEPLPPTDIGDLLAGSYENLREIPIKFLEAATDIVRETLVNAGRHGAGKGTAISRLWFPSDTRSIIIACTREPEPSRFSDADEPNYVHVDNFEDRDALLELSTFFARRYPLANVVPYFADDLPHGAEKGDLVVLGGPGCAPGEGNALTRDLIKMLGSQVRYPESGDGLIWREEPVRETVYRDGDDSKGVIGDWGSLLAAPNPFNPGARVILLHGTTTYGTLAAASAFTDSQIAMRNHLHLASLGLQNPLTLSLDFEALIRVEVDSARRIKPPTIEAVRRIESL